MRKRYMRVLFSVILAFSLCMALGAYALAAAGDVFTVTAVSGDSVLGLCQKAGIDFYTYKSIIMTLNGFKSDDEMQTIAVGRELYLPTSNESAAALTAAFAATGSGSSAGTVTTGGTGGSAGAGSPGQTTYPSYWETVPTPAPDTPESAGTLASGDTVSYYIVKYTIQSGDTLTGIYRTWGLDYKTFTNTILKLNKLKSVDKIRAGQSLFLPTTTVTDSVAYTIISHKIQSGETVTGICSSYGLDYRSSTAMLESLNPSMNFNKIRAGAYIYLALNGAYTA